jgi:hypothetical protein
MTRDQVNELRGLVIYADTFRIECHSAEYTDTEEAWRLIELFRAAAAKIVEEAGK